VIINTLALESEDYETANTKTAMQPETTDIPKEPIGASCLQLSIEEDLADKSKGELRPNLNLDSDDDLFPAIGEAEEVFIPKEPIGASCSQLNDDWVSGEVLSPAEETTEGNLEDKSKGGLLPILNLDSEEDLFPAMGEAEEALAEDDELREMEKQALDHAVDILMEGNTWETEHTHDTHSSLERTTQGREFLTTLKADDAPSYARMVTRMLEAQCGKPHRYGARVQHTIQKPKWHMRDTHERPPPSPHIDTSTPPLLPIHGRMTSPPALVMTKRSYELITRSSIYARLRKSKVVPRVRVDPHSTGMVIHPPKTPQKLTKRLTGKQPDPRN
jgi:hypothetical protein